jgi:cysteine desulfuration protein SufE
MLDFQDMFEELFIFEDPMDKYEYIIEYGSTASSIRLFEKVDSQLVKGCTSALWLVKQDSCFYCQADSAIVKGIAGMICDWYNQATAQQKETLSIEMLRATGLAPLLSMGRQNGVANLINKIKLLEQ